MCMFGDNSWANGVIRINISFLAFNNVQILMKMLIDL